MSKRNPEKTAALAREYLTRIRHALAEIDTLYVLGGTPSIYDVTKNRLFQLAGF